MPDLDRMRRSSSQPIDDQVEPNLTVRVGPDSIDIARPRRRRSTAPSRLPAFKIRGATSGGFTSRWQGSQIQRRRGRADPTSFFALSTSICAPPAPASWSLGNGLQYTTCWRHSNDRPPDLEGSGEHPPADYEEFSAGISHLVMGRGTYDKVVTFESWPYDRCRVLVLSTTVRAGDDSRITVVRSTTESAATPRRRRGHRCLRRRRTGTHRFPPSWPHRRTHHHPSSRHPRPWAAVVPRPTPPDPSRPPWHRKHWRRHGQHPLRRRTSRPVRLLTLQKPSILVRAQVTAELATANVVRIETTFRGVRFRSLVSGPNR